MSAYGQNSVIALAFQDAAGTSNVDSLHFLPFISEGVTLTKEPLISESMKGIFDEAEDVEGRNGVEGDIQIEAQSIALGAMLTAIFGPPTTSAVDSVFEHVWTPTTSDWSEKLAIRPTTIYKDLSEGGSAHIYYDMNGSAIELSGTAGEFLMASLTFVGGKESQQAPLTASFPNEKRWSWDVASVQIAANSGAALSALDAFMDFSISVDEQLEAQYTFNAAKTPSRIKRTGFRTVAVNGTLKFDNQDEYQQFKSQSERAMEIFFKGTTEVASGHPETLKVEIPALRYREFAPNADGPGPIEVGFTGAGKYHTGSGTAIKITLVNTQDAY